MRILITIACLMSAAPVWATDIPDADSPSAQLFAERCSVCHSLPHPKRLDWEHWRSMLHVMKQHMHERGMQMPDEEWRQIAAYLQAHAR